MRKVLNQGAIDKRRARLHQAGYTKDEVKAKVLGLLNLNAGLTALRQASEWGNAALARAYPRLRSLTSVKTDQQKILRVCVGLYNLRTRVIGQNQLNAYFDKEHRSACLDRTIGRKGRDMYAQYVW